MLELNRRALKRLDERLTAASFVDSLAVPPKGWIRAIRDALGMSGAQLGKRLGVTQQTVATIEKSEKNGTIQLQTLSKVADALDLQLVYALVPRTSLEDMANSRARQLAIRAISRVSQTMKLEAQGTGNRDLEARIEEYVRNELKSRDLWSEV